METTADVENDAVEEIKPRKNPWDKARQHAHYCASLNELGACPYKSPVWRSFWLREYQNAK